MSESCMKNNSGVFYLTNHFFGRVCRLFIFPVESGSYVWFLETTFFIGALLRIGVYGTKYTTGLISEYKNIT